MNRLCPWIEVDTSRETFRHDRNDARSSFGPVLALCGMLFASPAPAQRLQALIDAAPERSVLRVPAGIWDGNIELRKKLSIVGDQGTVIRGSGQGSTVTILADSCRLEGCIVERSGGMLAQEDAGILVKSSGNVLVNNELRDVLFGVYLFASHNNIIDSNRIRGRKELELGARGSGMHLWNSRGNSLKGNRVEDVRDGIYMQYANRTMIEGNDISGVRYGLHYMYADSNVFVGNVFRKNVAGAAVMYSRDIVIRRNMFIHNRGFASYGILFQDCHGITADSNIVADNVVGLFFEASSDNVFRHNIIAQNDVALTMFQNAERNVFTENTFVDNLSPITVIGRSTSTRWSEGTQGNFWSSYDGYDLDQDGIGDVPARIQNVFQYLEGQVPNLRLFLYSPAAQALSRATSAFPVLDMSKEFDRYPLMRPFDDRVLMQAYAATEARTKSEAVQQRPSLPVLSGLVVAFGVVTLLPFRFIKRRKMN